MAVDFTMKKGDRIPNFVVKLKGTSQGGNVVDVDLSDAGVRFVMTDKISGVKLIDADAEVVDELAGIVRYAWAAGDTDFPGTYKAEWEVTYGDGRSITFPNTRYMAVKIVADLGGVA